MATDQRSTIKVIFDGTSTGLVKAASVASAAIQGVGKATAGLAGLGAGVNAIAGIGAGLAQLAPAALLVPGAILAVQAAVQTFKVATSGFADAVGGDAAAMAKLAPAAREGARAVQELGRQFDTIRSAVQQEFFKGFADDVRLLGSTFLPTLRTGMTDVAGAFAEVRAASVKAIANPEQAEDLGNIFRNTAESIRGAGAGLGDFAAGFLQLGSIGSEFLPGLTAGVDGLGAKFRAFVEENPARIREMISGALSAFGDLFASISNIGVAIRNVFTSIAGPAGAGGAIETFRQLTGSIADFTDSLTAQNALAQFGSLLRQAGEIMSGILVEGLTIAANVFTALSPLITAAVTTFGQLADVVLGVLGPVIEDLARSLSGELAPALPALVDGFSDFMEALGPVISALAGPLARILGVAVTLFGNLLEAVAPVISALAPIVEIVGQALADAFTRLEPVITQVATVIGAFLAEALTQLQPLLPPLVDAFLSIVDTLAVLIPPLIEIAQAVFPILIAVLVQVVEGFTAVVTVVANVLAALAPVITFIAEWVAEIIGFIEPFVTDFITFFGELRTNVITFIGEMITGVITFITDMVTNVSTAVTDFVTNVSQFFSDLYTNVTTFVGDLVTGVITGIGNMATEAGAAISNFVSTALTNIGNFVTDAIGKITTWVGDMIAEAVRLKDEFVAWIQRLCDDVLKFLGELPGKALQIAKDLVNGLVQGIKDGVGAVGQAAADLAQSAWDAINSVFDFGSPSKLTTWGGKMAGAGLARGLEQSIPDILASARLAAEAARTGLGVDAPLTSVSAEVRSAATTGAALDSLLARAGAGTGNIVIKVYIGDKELGEIVRTEIGKDDADTADRVRAGGGTSF